MITAGIVIYTVNKDGSLDGRWTHTDLQGRVATERARGGTPGQLPGSYSVEIDAPGGPKIFEGTLEIAPLGAAYTLSWSGSILLPTRRPTTFFGIGLVEGNGPLVATFQEGARGMLREVGDKIPGPNGERFADAFTHGTLRALLYAPRGTDTQVPHEQDEVYVVMRGSGSFVVSGARRSFGEGDVLFVPARAEHRFEAFTDDLAVWAFFYGPPGGEATDDPRAAIERANAELAAAYAQGDARAVAAMYTADGQLFPPHSPIVSGPVAIEGFWKGAMNAGVKQVALATTEVTSLVDTAVETGALTLRGGDGAVLDQGKYVEPASGGNFTATAGTRTSPRPGVEERVQPVTTFSE